MKYEIKEFKMLPVKLLVPHPDALAFPSDEDDRAALDASIEGVGVLEPLTVIKSDALQYLVIDGCGRLDDAVAKGTADLPCLVVECDNPREFAANKNAMGRKRSTGSRILCYLMANMDKVIEAAESLRSCDRREDRIDALPAHLKPWTSREIARRLKVSDKDVVAAIQLVVCQTSGVSPDNAELDAAGRDQLDAVFTGVMSARTPIRRWKPAFEGKRVPAAGSGRAATNYGELATRTVVSLENVFTHWYEIPAGGRDFLTSKILAILQAAPEEVAQALAKRYADKKAK